LERARECDNNRRDKREADWGKNRCPAQTTRPITIHTGPTLIPHQRIVGMGASTLERAAMDILTNRACCRFPIGAGQTVNHFAPSLKTDQPKLASNLKTAGTKLL
jgi:hypothetical protein